ncbi:hypothetical protein [Anaerotruncus sp. AF02-27]|uniref:hypothetical protein n=1 Tax=Anaerotruncus sp. AF02-27 TaxID=2292191 RepID=UPI001313F4D5|nr:hypothetical protein [Anaerotruncus sp. AF02-27]
MAKKKQPPQDQKSLREMTIAEVEEARHAYNRLHPNDRIESYGKFVQRMGDKIP